MKFTELQKRYIESIKNGDIDIHIENGVVTHISEENSCFAYICKKSGEEKVIDIYTGEEVEEF